MTKGCVYYTDCRLDPVIAQACRDQLQRAAHGLPIAAVTLVEMSGQSQHETTWREPVFASLGCAGTRGYAAMFRQILVGLQWLDTDVAFLAEHDVAYHESHFAFTPPRDDTYYYNQHVWKVRSSDGHALHYPCSQTSGLCASRELLVNHYRKRVAMVEASGFTRAIGFEPGTHNRPERVDDFKAETWMSAVPNIDVRHSTNLTESRWTKSAFRNQKYTEGWTESDRIPGWPGITKGRFFEFLADAVRREVVT